ncbi:hypothetical protein JHK85_028237 [Glycine max]|nr:hypothetical protein JHK85_028237 [Glycine max]KAG5003577.1 hypothetical protein JHK86_027716 [Glycine max]
MDSGGGNTLGKDETRKEAYDLLLNISSTLRDSSFVGSIEPYHKLVSMAVLGFVKVMVSSLEARELQNILSEVIAEILPWSSVSRNHFKSKAYQNHNTQTAEPVPKHTERTVEVRHRTRKWLLETSTPVAMRKKQPGGITIVLHHDHR